MIRLAFKRVSGVFLLVLALAVSAQEELDPAIFDGTGRERREAPEEPAPAEGSESAEPEHAPGEKDASKEAGSSESVEVADDSAPPPPEEDAEPGGLGTKETTGEEVDAPETPGSPGKEMTESRAGERVESSEKIAPGQAVDFPWDL